MPAEYGFIDPLDPGKEIPENPVGDPTKGPLKDPLRDPLWIASSALPNLSGSDNVLKIAAMPSLEFGNSLLAGVTYVLLTSQPPSRAAPN